MTRTQIGCADQSGRCCPLERDEFNASWSARIAHCLMTSPFCGPLPCGMRPCHFERLLELCGGELCQLRSGPALLAPGVRHGMEGVGGDQAFELLFIGGEFEVRPAA